MNQEQHAQRAAQAYETYNVPALFRPWAGELLDRAAPQPGERILDLACGTGAVARLVAKRLNGRTTVVGLDLNPAMIEVARAAAEREGVAIAWQVGSADALPFPAESFELVLVHQGLQFFPDRTAAAREMHRVLTPEGRAATATWTELARNPFNQVVSEVVERHLGSAALATPFKLGRQDDLRALFVAAGFASVDIAVVEREVRFPSPEAFVEASITGAAAALPALQGIEGERLAQLVEAIRADLSGLLAQHTVGDELVYRREAHIVIARKAG